MRPVRLRKPIRGLPMRALVPNAITVLALCVGLSGVRFALHGQWEGALAFVIAAAVLDGFDGRIARLINGQTRFGAELDSLSDVIAFGVAPALIVYLWALQEMPRYGWIFALGHAAACALRLARFNAAIDTEDQPHESAGFLTGVPAPTGAGLLLLPLFLWMVTEADFLRSFYVVAPWTALVAFLMVSNLATYSWASLRVRRGFRFEMMVAIAAVIAALVTVPWVTLSVAAIAYAITIPFSIMSYARIRRRRAAPAPEAPPAPPLGPA